MCRNLKRVLLLTSIIVLYINCTKEEIDLPKKMDSIIGSWSPVIGLMTGEIIDGDYGKESFKYNFGECAKENGYITFKKDGSLDFINYTGSLSTGCKIIERSKNVLWENEGDSTFVASGIITQINNQSTYDDVNIDNLFLEPYLPFPDLVEVKNDTLILYFDKIPNTKLYTERFFYKRKD